MPRASSGRSRRGPSAGTATVSIEVTPTLAHDTQGTLVEARRLWKELDRPERDGEDPRRRVEGVPAIEQLRHRRASTSTSRCSSARTPTSRWPKRTSAGWRSAPPAASDVSRMRLGGELLRQPHRHAGGKPIAAREKAGGHAAAEGAASTRSGKVAIANAKLAYQNYKRLFSGPRWETLADKGARPSGCSGPAPAPRTRSTRDVLYVEELIGPDTVNTVPPATFDAFRDHGKLRPSLEEDVTSADETMRRAREVGHLA